MRRVVRAALLLSSVLFWREAAATPPPPDLVLLNGKVFTSEVKHLRVEALAIRGDRIIAIGDTKTVEALAGPATRRIDLGGRTVIPGINDAHVHLDVVPKGLIEVPLKSPDPSWSDVTGAVAAALLRAPKGSLLLGEIGPTVFYGAEATRDSLDKLAPDNPVILETLTGHAAILNSPALVKVGIREDVPDSSRRSLRARCQRSAHRGSPRVRRHPTLQGAGSLDERRRRRHSVERGARTGREARGYFGSGHE